MNLYISAEHAKELLKDMNISVKGVMMETIEERVESYKRFILSDSFEQCTASQRKKFHRIYPNGVPMACLNDAIKLCERTVRNNLCAEADNKTKDKKIIGKS